jgi:hypothetical protein
MQLARIKAGASEADKTLIYNLNISEMERKFTDIDKEIKALKEARSGRA